MMYLYLWDVTDLDYNGIFSHSALAESGHLSDYELTEAERLEKAEFSVENSKIYLKEYRKVYQGRRRLGDKPLHELTWLDWAPIRKSASSSWLLLQRPTTSRNCVRFHLWQTASACSIYSMQQSNTSKAGPLVVYPDSGLRGLERFTPSSMTILK